MTAAPPDDALEPALRRLADAIDDDGFSQQVLRRLPARRVAVDVSAAGWQARQQRLRRVRVATLTGLGGGLAVAQVVAQGAGHGPDQAALLALALAVSTAAAAWVLSRAGP